MAEFKARSRPDIAPRARRDSGPSEALPAKCRRLTEDPLRFLKSCFLLLPSRWHQVSVFFSSFIVIVFGRTRWHSCQHCRLTTRRSWVQFPGSEGLSVWFRVGFLRVLQFPPQSNTCSRLISSWCPPPKALLKIQIWSLGAAQWLPAAPQKMLG